LSPRGREFSLLKIDSGGKRNPTRPYSAGLQAAILGKLLSLPIVSHLLDR
jgi:hypothetical protein